MDSEAPAPRSRRTFAGFLPAALVVLILSVAASFMPLLSVLGYELAVCTAILLFLVGSGWGIGAARATGPVRFGALHDVQGTPWSEGNARLALRFRGGLVLAAVPVAVCLARQVLGQGCLVHTGLPLYTTLVLPALLLGLSVGFLAGALARNRFVAAGLVFLFVLASVAWTFAEGMTGPRTVLHNLILGSVTLSGYTGYDVSLAPPSTLIRYRIFTLALTLFLWALGGLILSLRLRAPDLEERLGLGLRRSRRRHLVLALLAVVLMAPFVAFPGACGLSSGQERLERALHATRETAHVRLHYTPGGRAETVAARAALTAEWWVRNLSPRLGIEPFPVDVWLYSSERQQARLTGARGFLYAQPWRGALHVQVSGSRIPALEHEMVHVLAGEFGPPPFAASWLPGLTEGLATALDRGMDLEEGAHAEAAAAQARGHLPPPDEFLGLMAFGRSGMRRSYNAAGSFCGWLLMTRGPDPMREAYRTGNVQAAYGESLESLEQGWTGFLEEITFEPVHEAGAVRRYSKEHNPPFFATVCPRVGSLIAEEALAKEGNRLYRGGNREAAAELFAAWAALRPHRRERAMLRAGRIWSRAGDPRGPMLLAEVAERGGPETHAALVALYREGVRRSDPDLATRALGRMRAGRFLRPEEGELLEARTAASRRFDPLRGEAAPEATGLAWALHPLGGRRLDLAEHREIVERLAASGEMPLTARRTLEILAAREMENGRYEDARRHLERILEMNEASPDDRRIRQLADLVGWLEESEEEAVEEEPVGDDSFEDEAP